MLVQTLLRRWIPIVAFGLFAGGCWYASGQADFEAVEVEPFDYSNRLKTPVFSVRRMPRSLQLPIADEALKPAIEQAEQLATGRNCISVVSATGELNPAPEPAPAFVPASNQKLLTTFVALELLGPDFRFTTSVETADPIIDGVVKGDLFLVGGGDPYLATGDWWTQYEDTNGRSATSLEQLADSVVAAGITEVEGAVVGDESLFDGTRTGPWADRLVTSNQSGPLSALTVNEGFVDWPDTFPGNSFQRSPAPSPPENGASVFAELLGDRGVTVGAVEVGTAPETATEVAVIESPPLKETVTHINSYSSNIGAELLLKYLGVAHGEGGSTAAGAEVVLDTLESMNISTDGVNVDDGSGLGSSNQLTCQTLADVLASAGSESDFAQSLSISGERGSLAESYVGTAAEGVVLAKTGTLNDVIALAGYVQPADDEGQVLAFVFVANGTLLSLEPETLQARDDLVLALADYPQAPGLEELSPQDAVEQ